MISPSSSFLSVRRKVEIDSNALDFLVSNLISSPTGVASASSVQPEPHSPEAALGPASRGWRGGVAVPPLRRPSALADGRCHLALRPHKEQGAAAPAATADAGTIPKKRHQQHSCRYDTKKQNKHSFRYDTKGRTTAHAGTIPNK